MAKTVREAFNIFLTQSVNLDPIVSNSAKNNLDNLLKEINSISGDNFFVLCTDYNLHFGSFSRKTKCRELDDLDVMVGISAEWATYCEYKWDNIVLTPKNSKAQNRCLDLSGHIDSNKVLGQFKTRLKDICDLRVSEVTKNGEAITVNYKSKEWSFDIVPCFYTNPQSDGRCYYLIPNANGQWKKTDPRIDQQRINDTKAKLGGNEVLNAIRLFKYWNKHAKVVTLDGYVMECLLMDYFDTIDCLPDSIAKTFVLMMEYVRDHIMNLIQDPKGIQSDLNNLSWSERANIKQKADIIYGNARLAVLSEKNYEYQKAINIWRNIFGEEFPIYG